MKITIPSCKRIIISSIGMLFFIAATNSLGCSPLGSTKECDNDKLCNKTCMGADTHHSQPHWGSCKCSPF
jgi:hypothetical protein